MRRFFVGLAIIAMLGLVPCKVRANDRQIIQQIVNALREQKDSGNLRGFNIDLQVEDGAVYLKGHVSTKEQEQLALETAREVQGVKQVHNEMKILATNASESKAKSKTAVKSASQSEGKTGILPALFSSSRRKLAEDSETAPAVAPEPEAKAIAAEPAESNESKSRQLAQTVVSRLKAEQQKGALKGFSMDLEVDDGIVFLTGSVANPEQQNLVLDIVRRIPGVTQVVNGLTVVAQSKAPTEITQEIIGKLQAKKSRGELKDFQVDIQAEEGIVWLSGSAASEEQRQIMLDVARHTPGVSKVVNDISIETADASITNLASTTLQAARSEEKQTASSPLVQAANREPIVRAPQVLSDAPVGSSVANVPAMAPPQPLPQDAVGVPSPIPQPQKRPTIRYMWVPMQGPTATGIAAAPAPQAPLAFAPARPAAYEAVGGAHGGAQAGQPVPLNPSMPGVGIAPARFDHPQMPQYAWPSYAAYPNYGAVTYPKQYSPMAWPYIGPFYPYPQVPLGWRKVTLEWDDGWWHLDFKSR